MGLHESIHTCNVGFAILFEYMEDNYLNRLELSQSNCQIKKWLPACNW